MTITGQDAPRDLLAATRPEHADRCREREAAAWQQLATLKPFDKITLQAAAGHIELIVRSVHAGDDADLRAAYICCAERLTRADVTVIQPHLRAGFYWIRPGWDL